MEITLNKPITIDGKTYSKVYFNIGPISQQSGNPVAIRLTPYNDDGEFPGEHSIPIIIDNQDKIYELVQSIIDERGL